MTARHLVCIILAAVDLFVLLPAKRRPHGLRSDDIATFRVTVALTAGIAPCVPGFLAAVGWAKLPAVWTEVYHYAWFLSFGVSFAVYFALMGRQTVASGEPAGTMAAVPRKEAS